MNLSLIEENIINLYRKLPTEEQEEILDIIKLKLKKHTKKQTQPKSSILEEDNKKIG